MKKLREYLEILFEGKKIRGVNLTPCEIYILADIYDEIAAGGKPEFFQETINTVLNKCGIKTIKKVITWKVA